MRNHNARMALKLLLTVALPQLLILASLCASAETLYVTASELNGRASPSKKSQIEAVFYRDEVVETTGKVHGDWIEVVGGETGTVWCSAKYLSESAASRVFYRNTSGGRVRTRTQPNGKSSGWISANKRVLISSTVDGWGYIENKGWVDLNYFTQEK